MAGHSPRQSHLPRPTARDSLGGFARAIILWLILNLLAIIFSAARAWPTARPPVAPEQYAVQVLLIVEVIAATVFWNVLFAPSTPRSQDRQEKNYSPLGALGSLAAWRALLLVVIAIPFIQLATVLANLPLSSTYPSIVYLTLFFIALSLWPRSRHAHQGILLGIIGPVIAGYLSSEFRNIDIPWIWNLDPIFVVVHPAKAGFIFILIFILAEIPLRLVRPRPAPSEL